MRYPWMRHLLMLAVFISFPVMATAGPPATVTMTQVGVSAIDGDDRDGARQAAIQDALRAAVDRVLVDVMPADALVGHFSTLDRMVASRYGDHIASFKLLTESVSTDAFRVLVQATVSTSGLRRKIAAAGISIGKTPLPKLLIFVSETIAGMDGQRYWWQPGGSANTILTATALNGPFTAKGYTVASPGRPVRGRPPELPDTPDLDLATARSAAKRYGAEVILVGSGIADASTNTMGHELKTYKATVTVRAYRVSNGALLAESTKEVFASGPSDAAGMHAAIADAGQAAGEELAVKVAAAWLSAGGAISEIAVTAEGSTEIIDYVMFRRALKKMPGVKAIQTRTMRPGLARFIVEFQGREKALAQGMMLTQFDRFRLDIFDIETGSLKVQLIPR